MLNVTKLILAAAVGVSGLTLTGCMTDSPETRTEAQALRSEGQAALERMYARDPELRNLLDTAHGYAVFPSVGKAGVIVGGSSGRGEVYEQGRLVGYATLNSLSAGAQVGGQEMSQLILFETPEALRRFQDQETAFTLNASAVAVKQGASNEAVFKDGIAVFTLPTGGFMAEATVAGQQFKYEPLNQAQAKMTDDRSLNVDVDRNDAEVRMEAQPAGYREGTTTEREVDVDVDVDRQRQDEPVRQERKTEIRTETETTVEPR